MIQWTLQRRIKETHPILDLPGPCRGNQGLELKHKHNVVVYNLFRKESGKEDYYILINILLYKIIVKTAVDDSTTQDVDTNCIYV